VRQPAMTFGTQRMSPSRCSTASRFHRPSPWTSPNRSARAPASLPWCGTTADGLEARADHGPCELSSTTLRTSGSGGDVTICGGVGSDDPLVAPSDRRDVRGDPWRQGKGSRRPRSSSSTSAGPHPQVGATSGSRAGGRRRGGGWRSPATRGANRAGAAPTWNDAVKVPLASGNDLPWPSLFGGTFHARVP
jgi:hypothetical protein